MFLGSQKSLESPGSDPGSDPDSPWSPLSNHVCLTCEGPYRYFNCNVIQSTSWISTVLEDRGKALWHQRNLILDPAVMEDRTIKWRQLESKVLLSPAEKEGEDRLVHRLLSHHVVENRVSQDICQERVAHPENTIKPRHDKGTTRLVDRLPELLIQDGQTPDLEQETTG